MSTEENSYGEQKKSYAGKDCFKTFFRPEHLSRHRLNHRPKAVFSCTQCPKQFVRMDLLHRHEKRHAKGMHYRSTGGVVKPAMTEDMAKNDEEVSSTAIACQNMSPSEPPDFQPGSISMAEDQYVSSISGSLMGRDYFETNEVNPLFFDASTDFQDMPNDLDWFFQDVMQKTPSACSVSEYDTVMEPALFPYLQQEPNSLSRYNSSPWETASSILRSSLEDLPSDILRSQFVDPSQLAEFYDLYFNNYHPHFPFLHRPSLIPVEMPPLLLTAIVALGSTLSPDSFNFEISIKIHEYLRWKVLSSETFEPPAPLWCLQTLLLIQAHGKMFSTRKHHELAHIFHGTIITLMRRGSAYTTTRSAENEDRTWHRWIENEASKRTAFFTFVMDAQHSSLFGHTPVLSVNDIRLPLPCLDSLWDAPTSDSWKELEKQEVENLQFLPVLRSLLGKHPVPASCPAYSRFILLHGLYSIIFHLQAKDSSTLGVGTRRIISADFPSTPTIDDWRDILDRAIETWSFSLLSQTSSLCLDAARSLYRMAHITIYTSIIDIHIIAGAPSLLGSLLSSNDKAKANIRIRAWSEKPEARKALSHSLLLIQETLFTGRPYRASEDNISLRPWSLYHATLVIWAYGFVTESYKSSNRINNIGAEEFLVRMRTGLTGPGELKGANQTRGLLSTVRESLRNCRWELLQEAYTTLGRLIDMPSS